MALTHAETEERFRQPFIRLTAYVRNLGYVTMLAKGGIQALTIVPHLIAAYPTLAGVTGHSETEAELQRIEVVRQGSEAHAALAEQETAQDFPLLHGFAVVGLWTALECFARDLAIALLASPATRTRATERLSKIKLKVPVTELWSLADRADELLDLIEREIGGPLKEGTGHFDSILELFGMSTPISDNAKRSIYEMGQLRNAIVHRGGIVDQKCATNLPYLGLAIGSGIAISSETFTRYLEAAIEYVDSRRLDLNLMFEKLADETSTTQVR